MAHETKSAVIGFDLCIEAGGWQPEESLREAAVRAVDATVDHLSLEADEPAELSFLFTDDAHIRALNEDWRGKNGATNVLSFPAFDMAIGEALPPMLGDIVLARETIEREAHLENKAFDDHLTHLMVHGLLHLLGYDHAEPLEAEHMEACERAILARLGIADPYA